MLALLLFCAGVSPGVAGGPSEFTYRTNVDVVQLNFSATDQNDHGVATLQASDFAVVDKDFIVRNFQSFTRSDWTKLEIAILVDTSGSVTPHFRQEMGDIVDLVSQTTGIPDRNLSIFYFQGVKPTLVCAEDCRSSHAAEQLPSGRAGGLTPLFDTVIYAADYLSHHGDAHAEKVLILLSDGEDTISRYSLSAAMDAALQNEVQVYGINLNRSGSTRGAGTLYTLAQTTGGRYFPPQGGTTRAMNAILEGFRASYTVSYRLPSHATGFHTTHIVPTHNLNLLFRSRSGYYYPNYLR